ncbi:MAG: TolC family protein, partial [Armatimonadota bacterium]
IQARNGLDLSRAALNNAMGVPQDREYDLATSFVKPLAEVDDLAALVAQAEQARPETRQVEAQIAAAGAAADLARSAKHPTLGVGWVYNRVLDMSAFQVSNWTLALQAAITIFDGKQTSAAVARARREQDSARALLEQLRQGIALEVRQAYLSLGSARERIAAAAKGVEQAEEAYRIATVRYDAGVSISVEVIDAEVALSSARNQYAHAVYDYNVGLAQLEYAVGATQPGEQQSAAAPILRMEQPAS